jgi:hypothetical protein
MKRQSKALGFGIPMRYESIRSLIHRLVGYLEGNRFVRFRRKQQILILLPSRRGIVLLLMLTTVGGWWWRRRRWWFDALFKRRHEAMARLNPIHIEFGVMQFEG